MNLSLERVVDSTISLLEFAATWWLQASVLLAAAFVASICLRSRGPAFHSVIFRVTLCAVLLCPLITKVLTISGASLFSLDLRSMVVEEEEPVVSAPTVSDTIQLAEHSSNNVRVASQLDPFGANYPPESETAIDSKLDPFAEPVPETKAQAASVASIATPTDVDPKSSFSFIYVLETLLAVWILGTATLLVKILRDLYHSKQILRSSVSGDESAVNICGQIASKLKLKTPNVQINPFLNSPCLLGHWRPTVLLPEETEPATYPQVFLHELAHLRRGDWLWNLVGRFAIALLWSQPLIWWLQRRSLTVAEEICDDYVIEYGCNREGYLRQLVEIAERSLPLAGATGVSMVGFRTKLGNRATRILDTTRALSTRAGRRFACFIMLATLAVTMGVALIEVGRPAVALAEEPTTAETSNNKSDPFGSAPQTASADALDFKKIRNYRGKVLDPSGKPVAGATVYIEVMKGDLNRGSRTAKTVSTTKSSQDGSYELTYHPADGLDYIIATTVEHGPAVMSFDTLYRKLVAGESTFDLQLSKKKNIQGRIVDTEGNPISGVNVHVLEVSFAKDEKSVTDWIANEKPEMFRNPKDNMFGMWNDSRLENTAFPVQTSLLASSINPSDTKTAQDGKFTIAGLPENSRCILHLTGPTIASRTAIVVAREMKGVLGYHWLGRGTDYTHYGQSPTIIASPTQPIVGQIVDAATKQPIPNVKVELSDVVKGTFWRNDASSNVTDANGQFTILGASLGGKHFIEIIPPLDQPYFSFTKELTVSSGTAPIQYNLELPRAKWIKGTIKDQDGKPMVATLHYYPFRDNLYAEKYPNWDPITHSRVPEERIVSDEQGRFRIQAIPGHAVLGAIVKTRDEQAKYMPNLSEDLIEKVGGVDMPKTFNSWSAIDFDALVEVNFDEALEEIQQDLQFVKGTVRVTHVKDDHGQKMTKLSVLGSVSPPQFNISEPLEDSSFSIVGLSPNESRSVVLLSPDKRIGKAMLVSGSDSNPLNVQLEPCSTVTGRVVDADGQGVRDIDIHASVVLEANTDSWAREISEVQTDADGKFSISLPVGALFRVSSYLPDGPNINAIIRPQSGAKYQLGDLKHDVELDEAATKALEVASTSSPENNIVFVKKPVEGEAASTNTFTGLVQDEQGKTVSGAFVSLIATKRDGDTYLYAESLGETKSGTDGKYSLTLKDVSSKTHVNAHVLVRTESSGIAAFPVNFDGVPQELGTAKLQPQQIVKVKLINLEGRPAANVRLNIGAIMTASLGVGFEQIKGNPAAWFPELESDSEGMLEIHNLIAGQGVYLNVPATDDFAPQHVALNTGMPAERPERDRTYRPTIVNAAPGEIATVPLAPAKIFEGTVILGENGPPAANAKISISASQQELGSMINTFSMTDANGHFRLNPQPGIIFGINAHPPEGAPFQIARLEGLRWTAGEQSKQLKITLQKGVFATGKVVDADTKQPIPNASVLYDPSGTNPNSTESVVTGWQGIKKTNEKGEFSIAVLPGEGWLYIQSDDRSYILQTKQSRELESGNKGGRYLYAHDFAKINAHATDQLAPLTIELHKGKTAKIIASAPNGSPIKEGLAVSRLKVYAVSAGMWRAQNPDEIRNGLVIFEGLAQGVTYPIYLLDSVQRLGATINISADQREIKVTLEPTGSVKARFLDSDGKPLAGQDLNPMFVATPGLGMFEMSDANRDAVLADEDFEVNYDRDSNPRRRSGNDGVSIVSTLIPGATYRYYIGRERREFIAKSGETYDLGDIKVSADGTQSVAKAASSVETKVVANESTIPSKQSENVINVLGTVVDQTGKPVPAAAISFVARGGINRSTAISAEDGSFEIACNRKYPEGTRFTPESSLYGILVVRASGYANSWIGGEELAKNPKPRITMVRDDFPVSGQILDLEGNPVPGAKIEIDSVLEPGNADLSSLWTGLLTETSNIEGAFRKFSSTWYGNVGLKVTRGQVIPGSGRAMTVNSPNATDSLYIQTDNEGRFEMQGVGNNRFVRATVFGDSIQYAKSYIQATESIEQYWPPKDDTGSVRKSSLPWTRIYPATFKHLAKPSHPITGYVREAKTGIPLAGVGVRGKVIAEADEAYDVTDSEGHYKLTGLATAGKLLIYAVPTRLEEPLPPHLGAEKPEITFTTATPPTNLDFQLNKGVLVRGKLVDQFGKPLVGTISYVPHRDNQVLKNSQDRFSRFEQRQSKRDGSFEIAVLPGPGVLTATDFSFNSPKEYYRPGKSSNDGSTVKPNEYLTYFGPLKAESFKTAIPIDIDLHDQLNITLTLEKTTDVSFANFFDESGAKLRFVYIAGRYPFQKVFPNVAFGGQPVEVQDMGEANRRPIVFVERIQKLSAIAFGTDDPRSPKLSQLPIDQDKSVQVTLQKSASVTGKLVSADGTPFTSATLLPYLISKPYNEARSIEFPQAKVSEDGSFLIESLPAAGPYVLLVQDMSNQGYISTGFDLAVGQKLDIGNVDVGKLISQQELMKP